MPFSPDPIRSFTRLSAAFVAALVFLSVAACGDADGDRADQVRAAPGVGEEATGTRAPARGMSWVVFNSDTVNAEVADTPEAREQGLMFRERLDPGDGMLFVFDDTQTRSFWMQDTYIPLDIAFMDSDFRIVDIQQMEPLTTEFYESAEPAMFALEVPQGWFEEQGIEVGDDARVIFGPR